MPCRNSSAAVQQAQPFCSSTVSSGDDVPPVFLDTSAASMFISATSFTMRPTLIPALFSSRCFSSVVLPAPRKPESSVIGVVSGKSIFSPAPAISVCPGPTCGRTRVCRRAQRGGSRDVRRGACQPSKKYSTVSIPSKSKRGRQRCMCLLAYCYAIHVTPRQTQQRALPPSDARWFARSARCPRGAVSPTCPPPPTPHMRPSPQHSARPLRATIPRVRARVAASARRQDRTTPPSRANLIAPGSRPAHERPPHG